MEYSDKSSDFIDDDECADDGHRSEKSGEGDTEGFQEVTRRKSPKEKPRDDVTAPRPVAQETQETDSIARRGGKENNSAVTFNNNAATKKTPLLKHPGPAPDRSRQTKLPPRLAKQRENRMNGSSASDVAAGNSQSGYSAAAPQQSTATPPPPPKNAWEKPLTATLRSNSPSSPAMPQDASAPAPLKGPGEALLETPDLSQVVASSNQRASPHCIAQVMTKDDKKNLDGSSVPSKTIIFENTNFKASSSGRDFGSMVSGGGVQYNNTYESGKPQRQREQRDRRGGAMHHHQQDMSSQQLQHSQQSTSHQHPGPQQSNNLHQPPLQQQISQQSYSSQQHQPPVPQQLQSPASSVGPRSASPRVPPASLQHKSDSEMRTKPDGPELPMSFPKDTENDSNCKLEFTFDPDLSDLNAVKVNASKSLNLVRPLVLSPSVHAPNSPSTEELNMKIASVKKVWDLPAVSENVEETVNHPNSFSTTNFSSVSTHDSANSGLEQHPAVMESYTPKESSSIAVDAKEANVMYSCGGPLMQQPGPASACNSNVASNGGVSNMVYTSVAAAVSAEVSRSGNVCKVKPQQQSAGGAGSVAGCVPIANCVSPGPGNVNVAAVTAGVVAAMSLATSGGGSMSPPLVSASASLSSNSNVYQTLGGAANFGGISGAIPSPPIMFNSSQTVQTGLYQPFLEQRNASQFSQYTPYGLGQGLGNNAFGGQQSMFLQTPPLTAPTDMYPNNLSQYRMPPTAVAGFGQTQPQNQSTVLISSANSSLMSSAVKPSTQSFGGTTQQNFGTIGSKAGTPFQQGGLGNTLQGTPQTPLYIYEPVQPMSLLGSQLMQRPPVQGSVLQTVQTQNSYYSNNGSGGAGGGGPSAAPTQPAAAGYYGPGSNMQAAVAAVQQQSQPPALQTPPAYNIQGFTNQTQPVAAAAAAVGLQNFGSNIGLSAQQLSVANFRSNNSVTAGLPASFLKSLQPGAGMAAGAASSSVQDPTRQQMKSPNPVPNAFGSTYFPGQSGENTELT